MGEVTWSGAWPTPVLRPEVPRKLALVLLSVLERQALAGLAPAKHGGVVTLHHGTLADIWRTAYATPEGVLVFPHRQAFLLERYDALTLRPDWQAVYEAEAAPILADGFDWREV